MPQIIEDSRQQAGRHANVERWMRAHGVDFAPRARALPFGDYMREGSNVSVDTKQSMDELATNLGREHRRFAAECAKARDAGCRLVILVEAGEAYGEAAAVARWVGYRCRRCRLCNPLARETRCLRSKTGRKPMTGPRMLSIMRSMEDEYGVRFVFCSKQDTGRAICDLLGVTYDDGG